MEIILTSEKYIVAKSEDSQIIHLVQCFSGTKFATGQPIVEQFDTLEDACAYIDAIKGVDYTKENYKYLFEPPTEE